MNRYDLLDLCFGVREHREGTRVVELLNETTGDVLAHCDVIFPRVVVGRDTITVAGLMNVCVDPGHRGEGLATEVVRQAHNVALAHEMIDFAAVFALCIGLFEPFGYEHPEGAIDYVDLLVAPLRDEPWPPGIVRVTRTW